MTILADHPARSTFVAPDLLGLDSRLSAVFDILRHKETNCPITIGIYGDWGTGKTSAMRWLETELRNWNTRSDEQRHGHPRVYPVWFDPWKYHNREDVWRGIIAEVILSLFSVHSLDHQNIVPRMTQAAKKFGSFLGRSFLHALSAIELKAGAGFVGTGAELKVKGEMFRDIYDEFESTNRPERPFLNEFEKTLQEWIRGFLQHKDEKFSERIALFIDDLDRCLPDVTLEVLEAIKLYLNIQPITFVVGVDRSVVDGLVAKHYGDKGLDPRKSEQFLDKIFQVEVQIPPSEAQMHGFLQLQIDGIDAATGHYWSRMLDTQDSRTPIEQAIRQLAQYNPRETKRILNSTLLRGRAAADNRDLLTKFADRKRLFVQGVQFFLIQRFVRNKMSHADRLLLSADALNWLQRLSELLCAYPQFQPPQRPSTAEGTRLPTSMEDTTTKSDAQILYEKLESERPYDDEGKPIDVFLLEDPIFWALLRIPFSAEVAQSAAVLVSRKPAFVPASMPSDHGEPKPLANLADALPSVLRDRVASQLKKPVDQLGSADVISLTRLNLSSSGLTDRDLIHIPLFTSLDDLNLNYTAITDLGLEHVAKVSSLTRLSLNTTPVTDAGVRIILNLPNLRSLFLLNTRITKASLAGLVEHPLNSLWVGGSHVTDEWLPILAQKKSLWGLSLSGAAITDAGFRELLTLEELYFLVLDYTQITDAGLSDISRLSLRYLYVGHTAITDAGLKHIVRIPLLTLLGLQYTAITDSGLPLLANLSSLSELELGGTGVTDAGLQHLASLTSLSTLRLDNTAITDAGLKSLQSLQGLKSLNIVRTNTTPSGIAELRTHLPGLEIQTE